MTNPDGTDVPGSRPVALVTGGAQRIGAAIVRALHSEGHAIALHYRRSRAPAEALAAELEALGGAPVRTFAADLAVAGEAEALADAVLDAFGRCDLLVNNASAFAPSTLGSVDERAWSELLDGNLRGPFFLTQRLAPALTEGRGAVVNVTDIHIDRPLAGYPVYTLAKAGVAAMTRSLALELAPDVRVNAVAPGAILWPEEADWAERRERMLERIPLARRGEPEDIAGAVVFLAAAPYVTGQTLAVDGGLSITS